MPRGLFLSTPLMLTPVSPPLRTGAVGVIATFVVKEI